MSKPPYSSYNFYFLVPAVIWLIAGGIALLAFDKQTLFFFFNTHHSSFADVYMYYISKFGEGLLGTLILMMMLGASSLRNWWYFLTALFTNALPAILVQVIKSIVHAPRPLKYFNDANWIHILPLWPRLMDRSFPSGHSCAAFCLFGFLSFMLPPRYKPFGFLFFVFAIFVAYSRMYLAAHFFLDIYMGSAIGIVCTTAIFAIMRHYRPAFFKPGTEANIE